MFVNDKRQDWMKTFSPYNQVLDFQRASLTYYRQLLEGQDSTRASGDYHGEAVRNLMESFGPFFATERVIRRQVVKLQSAMLDACEETLRASTSTRTEK